MPKYFTPSHSFKIFLFTKRRNVYDYSRNNEVHILNVGFAQILIALVVGISILEGTVSREICVRQAFQTNSKIKWEGNITVADEVRPKQPANCVRHYRTIIHRK